MSSAGAQAAPSVPPSLFPPVLTLRVMSCSCCQPVKDVWESELPHVTEGLPSEQKNWGKKRNLITRKNT